MLFLKNVDTRALGYELSTTVARLPRRPFYLVDNAPENYAELRSVTSKALPILAGCSDHTIFGAPSANHIQRAVHDTIHLQLGADTSEAGELRVAVEQCRLVGHYSSSLAEVMYADLRGQTLYYVRHGAFPSDQRAFVLHWLRTRDVGRVF